MSNSSNQTLVQQLKQITSQVKPSIHQTALRSLYNSIPTRITYTHEAFIPYEFDSLDDLNHRMRSIVLWVYTNTAGKLVIDYHNAGKVYAGISFTDPAELAMFKLQYAELDVSRLGDEVE